MAVNYKLGADVGSFKQGMQEAQASLKTLDMQLKANEASLKAGGNAQLYMEQKAQLLNSKMQQQKAMATQLQDAMKRMAESGVSTASVKYQQLYQQLLQAQTGMNETSVALNNLDGSQEQAAESAGQLEQNLSNIGKKVSLDAVIGGIDKITSGLESAAKKAVSLGETIWNEIMNSARWADDTATQALIAGMSATDYQAMKNVADTWGETSVDAILNARKRIQKNVSEMSDDVKNTFSKLGVSMYQWVETAGQSGPVSKMKDWQDIFWETGEALLAMDDAFKREDYAQTIFGRKWDELRPMFEMGRDAYQEAIDEQKTVTEKAVADLATLNDTVTQTQQRFETLKTEVLGGLAPALTGAADTVSELLGNLIDYAQSPEGQELITKLGESVGTLFEDLANVDPEDLVNSFVGVFDNLKAGFEWVINNKEDIVNALKYVVEGWAVLKLTGGALQIWQLISGIKGLSGASGVATSAVGGAAGVGAAAAGTTLGSRILNIATNGIAGAGGLAAGALNGVAVGDYLWNNTAVGQTLRDTGDIGAAADVVKKYFTETLPKNWDDFWKTSYWDDIFNFYSDNVQTTAKLVKNGVEKLGDVAKNVIVDPVAGFVEQTAEDINNLPEAVKQVTNATPEQNRNSFRTVIDTFIQSLTGGDGGGGGSHGFGLPMEPELESDAAEQLQQQASGITVQVGAQLVPVGYSTGAGMAALMLGADGSGLLSGIGKKANGIWSVPFDGYPAILHRGERVVPEREVSSRSYNSNLYVEKMYMNNGTDAEGLASAMAAAQRRRMSGYGS